ncbi:MAG TPA: hypothetical protein VNT80_02655 [Acidimicrobiales bacterium]|nr:hypothetical protein [Acidimicrobiales bacterium]
MIRDARPVRPKSVRRGLLVIVAALAGLSLAACGATHTPNVAGVGTTTLAPSTGNGVASNAGAFAFAQCMQTRGVSNFPEPNSRGIFPKETPEQLGVTESKYRSTQRACDHFLPNGGNGPSAAEIQHVTELGLEFARCMRAHGVDLPDPGSDGRIPDPATVGIDQGSPLFQAGNQACGKYRPPYMPTNAQYNAYARSQG